MEVALSLAIAAGFVLLYWKKEKHLLVSEQWFLWLSVIFILSTSFDIGTHRGWYTVTKEVPAFLSLRLLESTAFPAMVVGFVDSISVRRPAMHYITAFIAALLLSFGMELFCIHVLHAVTPDKWNIRMSFIAWMGLLVISYLMLWMFRFVWVKRRS